MDFAEYQKAAARTLIDSPGKEFSDQELMVVWVSAGIAGEAGELAESVLADNSCSIHKEVGDLLWYVAGLCTVQGLELDLLAPVGGVAPSSLTQDRVTLRLCSLAGELADYLKKVVFHGHDLEIDKLELKIHQLVLAILLFCKKFGLDPASVMDQNIEKLLQRYPDGFDRDRSRNREVES